MSNIEKIRQEIERLKKILEESTYYLDNSQQALGYSFALDDFKEFIDSLPDQKPSNLTPKDVKLISHLYQIVDEEEPNRFYNEVARRFNNIKKDG